jgi:hypothetical protein
MNKGAAEFRNHGWKFYDKMFELVGDKPVRGTHAYHPSRAAVASSMPELPPSLASEPASQSQSEDVDNADSETETFRNANIDADNLGFATQNQSSRKRKWQAIDEDLETGAARFPVPARPTPTRIRPLSTTASMIQEFKDDILDFSRSIITQSLSSAASPASNARLPVQASSSDNIFDQPTPKRKRIAISCVKERETYLTRNETVSLIDIFWDVPGLADRYNLLQDSDDDELHKAWVRKQLGI